MKFVDLYAGIGGFRYALESFGNECIFSLKSIIFLVETYKENFGDNSEFDMDLFSEMTDEEIDDLIGEHELLVGGFPCQSFSIAGKKQGFETTDTRGTQFFNILRILSVKKPKYIILENVKHLTQHDGGKTFEVINKELEKIGYNLSIKPLIVSPTDLGIPQKRERIFIVGNLEEEIGEIKIPKSEIKNLKLEKVSKTNLTKDELNYIKVWEEFIKNVKRTDTGTIPVIWLDEMLSKKILKIDKNEKLNMLKEWEVFIKKIKFIDSWLEKYKPNLWSNRKYRKLEWSSGSDNSSLREGKHIIIRPSGLRIRNTKHFPTQVASVETPIIFDSNINEFRKLTPREIARLQSFPEKHKLNKNDFQAYKQLGNAVNVDVVKFIYKELIK